MTRSDYFTGVRPAPTIATGASAGRHRLSRAARSAPMGKPSFAGRSFVGGFSRLNRRRPWHRLPLPVALVNLIALRVELRQHNLTDTRTPDPSTRREAVTLDQCPHLAGRYRTRRRLVQRPRRPGHGHGRLPVRPQRGPRQGGPRADARAHGAQPAHDQPHADAPRHLHAGHVAEPAGGRLDPVPDPRLVRPRPRPGVRLRGQPSRRALLAREPDAAAPHPRGPHADRRRQGPAADLHQPALALVGRLEHLRQLRGAAAARPHVHRRQAGAAGRPAPAGHQDRHGDHRVQRELVDRPRHAAHAVHPRAQRDLRRPEEGSTRR